MLIQFCPNVNTLFSVVAPTRDINVMHICFNLANPGHTQRETANIWESVSTRYPTLPSPLRPFLWRL